MLLQRIKLRGFLGHLGVRSEANGKADWVEVDFSSSPLWLVHGPNGGGKSSLWDALTFALFKEHRIGGKSFDKLVHDKADKAEVSLEFDLRGNRFQIGAEIAVKGKKRSVKTSRVVRAWNGSDWETVADNERNIEDWLSRNLSLSFNTFTSAVLLRQGDADKFLKAKPTECREVLTELLQLRFYRELDAAATKRRNREKEKLDDSERRLGGLPNPTDEEVTRQSQIISTNQDSLAKLNEQVEQKRLEAEQALRFEHLSAEIAEKQKQQQEYAAVMAEAASIEAAVRRYRELKDGLIQIDKVWETQEELLRETQALQEMQAHIATTQELLREALAKLETQYQDEKRAQASLAQAETSLETAQQRKAQAEKQVKILAQIESFEAAIAHEQEKLHPHLSILAERERIERAWQRYEELSQAIPLLETLAQTALQLEQVKTELIEAETNVGSHSQRLQQAEADEKRCQARLDQIATEKK